MNKTFKCSECSNDYLYYKNLRKHVKKSHPDKVSDIAPLLKSKKMFKYKCEYCEKQYNHLYNCRAHERKVHNSENGAVFDGHKYKKLKCPLCDETYTLKQKLFNHFESAHKVTLKVETLKFDSYGSFIQWKEVIEKETLSKYIKEHGSKKDVFNSLKHYFICHRSGHYVPEGSGLRKLKSQGSQKINGTCPASLLVHEKEDGMCYIKYISTHVGHNMEVSYLSLTPNEKNDLALEIANKTPFQIILEKVHNANDAGLSRINLLKKKDLYNIKSRLKLLTSDKHLNRKVTLEKDGVKSLLDEITASDSSCVVFHKLPESENCKYPELNNEDSLFVLINAKQCDTLRKNGTEFVCVSRTNESNRYGFELLTVFTINNNNNNNHVYPCAFLVSNRWDLYIMKIFFECIKSVSGNISCKVFMSDRDPDIFDSWVSVMDNPSMWLYCSWHVETMWEKNLSRIKTFDKQNEVFAVLKFLMEDPESTSFNEKLNLVVEELVNDPVTNDFGNYFAEGFSKNCSYWAFCFRRDNILKMNTYFERLHKTLKYHFLLGKKQLDKSLNPLMTFVKDKFLNESNDIKLSNIMNEIKYRHKCSLKSVTDLVVEEESGWKIQSTFDVKDVNFVRKNVLTCQPDCILVCKDCNNCCIHQYVCSCIDSYIKWNMCKHIHLLCSVLCSQQINNYLISSNDSKSDTDSQIVVTSHVINETEITGIGNIFTIPVESEVVVSEEILEFDDNDCVEVTSFYPDATTTNVDNEDNVVNNSNVSFDTEKENVKQEMIDLINNLTTPDELEIVKQSILSLQDMLTDVRTQTVCVATSDQEEVATEIIIENVEEKQIEPLANRKRIISYNNVLPSKKVKSSLRTLLMDLS